MIKQSQRQLNVEERQRPCLWGLQPASYQSYMQQGASRLQPNRKSLITVNGASISMQPGKYAGIAGMCN